jgi:hypothetical protein
MLAGPVLRTILLQRTMSLPGAVSCPSPPLLPRHCLLLGTLRLLLLPGLLRLLGPLRLSLLLLLRLLGPLRLSLLLLLRLLGSLRLSLLLLLRLLGSLRLSLLLLLRLLGPLLLLRLLGPLLLLRLLGPLLLLRLLGPLLLLRLLGPLRLLPTPLRFRFALLLIALRVRRVNRPEKHKQGSGTDHSNQLHRNRPPFKIAIGCARKRPVRRTARSCSWLKTNRASTRTARLHAGFALGMQI